MAAPRTAKDRDALARLRRSVDAVNRRLRDLLDARLKAARVVAAWKAARGAPLRDAARERAMLAALGRGAAPGGFSKAARERLFRAIFRETRAALAREAGAARRTARRQTASSTS